jgi:hypothetical protein
MNKLMVLMFRHLISKDEFLLLDGKNLLVYAVHNGLIGTSAFKDIALGDVVIQDNFAKAHPIVFKESLPLYIKFYRIDGACKSSTTVGIRPDLKNHVSIRVEELPLVIDDIELATPGLYSGSIESRLRDQAYISL